MKYASSACESVLIPLFLEGMTYTSPFEHVVHSYQPHYKQLQSLYPIVSPF